MPEKATTIPIRPPTHPTVGDDTNPPFQVPPPDPTAGGHGAQHTHRGTDTTIKFGFYSDK